MISGNIISGYIAILGTNRVIEFFMALRKIVIAMIKTNLTEGTSCRDFVVDPHVS